MKHPVLSLITAVLLASAAAPALAQSLIVDTASVEQALQRGAVVWDARSAKEYAEGHITGAVNVPRGLLEFTIWEHVGFPKNVDKSKQLTLYCKTGGRCALATKTLMDLGFTNVTSADMLIADWQKAGYPMSKGPQ